MLNNSQLLILFEIFLQLKQLGIFYFVDGITAIGDGSSKCKSADIRRCILDIEIVLNPAIAIHRWVSYITTIHRCIWSILIRIIPILRMNIVILNLSRRRISTLIFSLHVVVAVVVVVTDDRRVIVTCWSGCCCSTNNLISSAGYS